MTIESLKLPNHCRCTQQLNYAIILISNTSPYWHIHLLGFSVSYDIPPSLWQPGQVIVLGWKNKAPSNFEQKLTFYLSFLTNLFLQFPSILGDVKYIILIGGLYLEDKAHLICGSGWGVGDVWGWCVHLWQSYIHAGWPPLGLQYRISVCTPAVYIYTCTINGRFLCSRCSIWVEGEDNVFPGVQHN